MNRCEELQFHSPFLFFSLSPFSHSTVFFPSPSLALLSPAFSERDINIKKVAEFSLSQLLLDTTTTTAAAAAFPLLISGTPWQKKIPELLLYIRG
jgi:hypothetical protein